jgi:hypothetical protein
MNKFTQSQTKQEKFGEIQLMALIFGGSSKSPRPVGVPVLEAHGESSYLCARIGHDLSPAKSSFVKIMLWNGHRKEEQF